MWFSQGPVQPTLVCPFPTYKNFFPRIMETISHYQKSNKVHCRKRDAISKCFGARLHTVTHSYESWQVADTAG
jgi:hypothetical protein